ncbi:MAG TPA: hypothetical protein VJ276_01450 [Thermoanaerobaculia bacterium]|nr:hypothetical protein [Thermoanaerobaculia bacterium]
MTAGDISKACVGCGDSEEMARLERCPICAKYFCSDCAVRGAGRRFCSPDCARNYFFHGDEDDDENDAGE